MSTKIALIVDDSKTAQVRLRKLLEKYNTNIEFAFSAEDALSMLPSLCPDIIFMDHSMDGMDGLEALKIIKSNPSTAMIPVIMYTAQSDDVYVSQARALGALDTLSKDVFQPSNLDDLMTRLHIQRRDEPKLQAVTDFASKQSATVSNPSPYREESNIYQIERRADDFIEPSVEPKVGNDQLLEALAIAETPYVDEFDQISLLSDIKKQLAWQAKHIEEMKKSFEHLSIDHISLDDVPLTILHDKARTERSRIRSRITSTFVFVLLGFVCSGYLLINFSKQIEGIKYSMVELGSALTELDTIPKVDVSNIPQTALEPQTYLDGNALVETLSWASTVDMQFAYGAAPLGDRQVINIQEFIERLSQSGYSGNVSINVQFGNFCLTPGPSSTEWVLADDSSALGNCMFYEDVYEEQTPESFLSIPYIQFEESSLSILSGEINVQINVAGFDNASVDYPPIDSIRTAKEWNAIAARNNRLSITIDPS